MSFCGLTRDFGPFLGGGNEILFAVAPEPAESEVRATGQPLPSADGKRCRAEGVGIRGKGRINP
jgi:hypothetical protein